MAQNPYDYSTRIGVHPISWEDMHGLCKGLARAAAAFAPDVILPVGRGGFYPGTLIAHMLQVEVYAVRLSRRIRDEVRYATPRWRQRPPRLVKGKRVLVVDEIAGAGETLRMVKAAVEALGAAEVRTAVLYAHTWGVDVPDYIGLISDALLLNPWDREVLRGEAFIFSPEVVEALALQDLTPDPGLRIGVEPPSIAKGGGR